MSTRRPLIAGNWKMYKTIAEAQKTASELIDRTAAADSVDIMIAPPFTAIASVAGIAANSRVAVGAQDLFWENDGAYTGEIAPGMLTEAGCRYVIIGHSERRQHFAETDETVNRKIAAAVKAGLVPILCIGESEAQREADETFSVLDKQVKRGLKGLFAKDLKKLVIAYEPIWAIGTGKTATSDQAQEVHRFLRQVLVELFDADFAQSVRILYGGSVKPANIAELMSMEDIDGALVGGASLDAETFARIVTF
ncbi:MAG: triosephosphate isomerase [Deltaproteobacteria bacterium SG8_13]|nr:MAG: triosephosphate isomerase [Deltaproteobacteria bacterium SG8_13]